MEPLLGHHGNPLQITESKSGHNKTFTPVEALIFQSNV